MNKIGSYALGVCVILISSCSDDVTAPAGDEFPEKLAPYEALHEAATLKKTR
jgi:hypothetical protein